MACFNIFDVFDIILHRACSMQHGVFDLSSTSLTCFNIHSIWWYGWKALSLSFSKLFCRLEISWILRKLWAKIRVYALFLSLTCLTYIVLQPLGVFDLSLTSLTFFNIYTQYLMVLLESPMSQLYKTFCGLQISWRLRKLWAKTCLYVIWAFD